MNETSIELTGQALAPLMIFMVKKTPPVHELPQWTNLKWTTPKNNNSEEYYLMFLAASINKLHITSASMFILYNL